MDYVIFAFIFLSGSLGPEWLFVPLEIIIPDYRWEFDDHGNEDDVLSWPIHLNVFEARDPAFFLDVFIEPQWVLG